MRIIAVGTLRRFWEQHPDARSSLARWHAVVRTASWAASADVQAAFPKAKVLDGERVRFEVAGGNYRMIVAFDYGRQVAFIKFLGTHAQYDKVDALTVSQF